MRFKFVIFYIFYILHILHIHSREFYTPIMFFYEGQFLKFTPFTQIQSIIDSKNIERIVCNHVLCFKVFYCTYLL